MNDTIVSDSFIPTLGGQLFVRQWQPEKTTPLTPIILLHDSLGSVELWRDFPLKLSVATGRIVIAYDRLGFGRSSAHPGLLQADFIKDEGRTALASVRESLNIGPMILLGHSVGGGMALSAGATYGEEVAGIITLAAQAFVEDRTVAGITEAKTNFANPDQVARLARYHGDKARWVLDAWIETWLAPSFADWTLDDDLRQLRSPVLAIHGENDEFGSKAHPERIAARSASRVQAEMIAGGGHMPHKDHTDQVLDLVVTFLKSNAIA